MCRTSEPATAFFSWPYLVASPYSYGHHICGLPGQVLRRCRSSWHPVKTLPPSASGGTSLAQAIYSSTRLLTSTRVPYNTRVNEDVIIHASIAATAPAAATAAAVADSFPRCGRIKSRRLKAVVSTDVSHEPRNVYRTCIC